MDIKVADQRLLLLTDQLTPAEALEKAGQKKLDSFGTVNKVAGFLSRPKDEDFELIYQEHRYQPFWHVAAHAHYVYDRSAQYQVSSGGPEVQSVTFAGQDFPISQGHIQLQVTEHCQQDEQEEVFVDGVSSKPQPDLKHLLSFPSQDVTTNMMEVVPKATILIPPQARVSAIMRDSLAKMIKGIQADQILEETVEVTAVDLYYHPIFAFQYHWQSKNKEAITEVDGLTGAVTTGNRTFHEYMGKVLDRDFLFDLGADAAGMFIPGGSMAVKVAKKYLDTKKAKAGK